MHETTHTHFPALFFRVIVSLKPLSLSHFRIFVVFSFFSFSLFFTSHQKELYRHSNVQWSDPEFFYISFKMAGVEQKDIFQELDAPLAIFLEVRVKSPICAFPLFKTGSCIESWKSPILRSWGAHSIFFWAPHSSRCCWFDRYFFAFNVAVINNKWPCFFS